RRVPRHGLRRPEAPGTEGAAHVQAGREHPRARRPRQAVFQAEAVRAEGASRVARDVPVAVARLRDGAGPRMDWILRLIPACDRDAIAGDLLEEAACRELSGARLQWWLLTECGAIAAGLSLERVRG